MLPTEGRDNELGADLDTRWLAIKTIETLLPFQHPFTTESCVETSIKMADQDNTLRVLIAGAGIAGLATAISLRRISGLSNVDVQIYEQAPELLEIGASIALSPNV